MRIVVDGVGASYGAKEVLRDISFALNPGEVVGLVGPNGHGKTTLMRRMLDLIPGTGETTFDGKPWCSLVSEHNLPLGGEEQDHLAFDAYFERAREARGPRLGSAPWRSPD